MEKKTGVKITVWTAKMTQKMKIVNNVEKNVLDAKIVLIY